MYASKSLALITLFDVFDCIIPECGPVVSLSDDFLSEIVPPSVAFAEPFVNLPEDHGTFRLTYTLEKWHEKALSI